MNSVFYTKKCIKCGTILTPFNTKDYNLKNSNYVCNSCIPKLELKRKQNWGRIISDIYKKTRERNLKYNLNLKPDITKKFLDDLFFKQNYKCFYTGKEIFFDVRGGSPYQPSLDRLHSDKWYTRDNVVICSVAQNYAKNNFKLRDWIEYITARDLEKIKDFSKKIEDIRNYYKLNPNYKEEEPEFFYPKTTQIIETNFQIELFSSIPNIEKPKQIVCKKEESTIKNDKPIQSEFNF